MSLAPIIGDPITVLAGIMRLLVVIAKAGRYLGLTAITLQFV
jgi:membrane protein YqaA with SNARE-associated domain